MYNFVKWLQQEILLKIGEKEMVPTLSIIFMAVSCLISFGLPIGLLLYLRISKKADLVSFFVGCAVMLVFALILESLVHRIVFATPVGDTILNNTLLYGLYGGLMAGVFEETGRLLAFKTVLKKNREKDINAVMYGAGHGGFEAIAIVGMTMINNIIWSVLINTGNMSALTEKVTGDVITQVEENIHQLTTLQPYMFLMGGVERIFAIVLHLALSVLVWFAVKKKGKGYLYFAAILIHMAVDALTVILSGAGIPAVALEAAVGGMALLAAIFAKAVWKRETAVLV